jgi:hypothetical protein
MQYREVNNAARELMAGIARYFQALSAVTTSGTGNAYVLTLDVNLGSAYPTGYTISFLCDRDNAAGGTTLNVNGIGSANILDNIGGSELAAASLRADRIYTVQYDGTQFRLLNGPQQLPGLSAIATDDSVVTADIDADLREFIVDEIFGIRITSDTEAQLYDKVTDRSLVTFRLDDDGTIAEVKIRKTGQTDLQDAGYNVLLENNVNADVTISLALNGEYLKKTDANNNTLTVTETNDFPVGGRMEIINRGTGNYSVSQGSNVTIRWLDGSTVNTGSRTVGPAGWATLHKESATEYLIVGQGLS